MKSRPQSFLRLPKKPRLVTTISITMSSITSRGICNQGKEARHDLSYFSGAFVSEVRIRKNVFDHKINIVICCCLCSHVVGGDVGLGLRFRRLFLPFLYHCFISLTSLSTVSNSFYMLLLFSIPLPRFPGIS